MWYKVIGLVLFLLYGTTVSANSSLICPPHPISFGLYENGLIYNSSIDHGIDKAIAEELARQSGCAFKFRTSTRARIWTDLESGALMMSGSGIQTPERDKFAWFIRCMGQKNYVIISKEFDAHSDQEYLNNKPSMQWGVIRRYKHGTVADAFLDKLRAQAHVYTVKDMDQLFRMLSLKRLSAGFAPPPVFPKYFKQYDLSEKMRVEDWFPEDASIPHGLIFSNKHFSANDMKHWRKIVTAMKENGTLKQIYETYLGKLGAQQMMDYQEITQNFEQE